MIDFLCELVRWTLAGEPEIGTRHRSRVAINAGSDSVPSSMVFSGFLKVYRRAVPDPAPLAEASKQLAAVLRDYDLPGDEAQVLDDALRSLHRLALADVDPESV